MSPQSGRPAIALRLIAGNDVEFLVPKSAKRTTEMDSGTELLAVASGPRHSTRARHWFSVLAIGQVESLTRSLPAPGSVPLSPVSRASFLKSGDIFAASVVLYLAARGDRQMSASSEQILQQTLALSPQDRAEILERLLASFQVPPDPHVDELWAREAEDRLDAYDRGELGAVPAEVFARIERLRGR